jgi:hypothetical protein
MNTFMNRVGQPAGVAQAPQPTAGGSKKKSFNFNLTKTLYGIVLAGMVIIILAIIVYMFTYRSNNPSITTAIKTDQYQAVFLNSSDGQVYFGKLAVFNTNFYKLTDIYYVRVQTVQPDKNSQPQQNISLAKLGNEIHGPEDVMYINKNNVMFLENLKEDGQVVKAIREYQKNGGKATTNQATPTPAVTPTPTTNR